MGVNVEPGMSGRLTETARTAAANAFAKDEDPLRSTIKEPESS